MTIKGMDNPTFNPMAWLSQSSEKAKSLAIKPPSSAPRACQPLSSAEELAKATAVARELIAIGANIAEDYNDYVRLGFALADGLGSSGRDIYHMLCAHSTKYRMRECEQKWQECLRKSDGRTSIATFYHMARQAGVDLSTLKFKKYVQ
jgi:hypothetical protein